MTHATTAAPVARPQSNEYAPYYAGYIAQVPEGDLIDALRDQISETLSLVRAIPKEHASHRYAPGKWSIKEVLGHMADVERIMGYRMLRIARGDTTPLAGFDENAYVPMGNFEFIETLEPEAAARRGTANNLDVSARALAYIIAGHERHHVRILKERYLKQQ
jgi:hypothetical protein